MVAIPLAQIFNDVTVLGATKRKVIRVKDTTIRTLRGGYIYIDVVENVDGSFLNYDPQTKVGNSLIGGWRFTHTGTDIVVAEDAAFNGQTAFTATGTEHHMSIPDPPSLHTYTFIGVYSVPQSVLDAADAFTLGNRYAWAVYDPVANAFKAGLQFTGSGSFKGWAFQPLQGSAVALNTSMATFPACRPTADVPFVIAQKIVAATTTSRFYFNDGETPINSRSDHLFMDPGGGDRRYYPLSFSIGSNVASWQGKMGCWLIHDDSDPSLAMTDDQRTAIVNEFKAAYNIA